MSPRGTVARFAALVLAAASPVLAAPEAGKPAPRFALRPLRDNTQLVSSKDLYAGKTTLVSFFATWCKPCLREIPAFRALGERYGDRGFQVVLVCLDRIGLDSVNSYLKEANSGDLPVFSDRYGRAKEAYSVAQLPTNVLVGPDERVLMSWEGDQPAKVKEVEARVEKLPPTGGTGEAKGGR